MPDSVAAWRRHKGKLPLVLGHRGAHGAAPENTLEAFENAVEQGAVGVELDVRLSQDGVVVVLHDRDLARVTGGQSQARAEDSSLMLLKSHDLGAGTRVPTLAEVLDWQRVRGVLLNVELKRDVVDRERLVRAVARTLLSAAVDPPQVLLSSFDPAMVKLAARVLPGFPMGYLLDSNWPRWPPARAFRRLGCHAVHPHESLVTPRFVESLANRGALVNVYGVNDEARARELSELGVDAVITDVPGTLLQALA